VSEPEACDLSRGIVTDDATRTITFHLVAPDPDFLYKLTLPFAYPVPPSAPDEEQVAAGVPGTGPYMLEAPMTGEGLALIRNPFFHVWSPAARPDGYVDRIEWTFGVERQAQIEAVVSGEADLAFDAGASRPGMLEEILVGFAGQVHTSPDAVTWFGVLDTGAPPFDNVDVRRAMNLAVDRDRVVQIFGGEAAARPTCQQLPPNFPGYQPYCPYTMDPGPEGAWTGPDVEKARRLVRRSGTRRMRVVVEIAPWFTGLFSKAQQTLLGDYMIELLGELGYRGSMRPPRDFYRPDHEWQMALDAWGEDYPAASNFITDRFTCDASLTPSAEFCDPRIDAMIERATQMQLDDPAEAGALWAEIDREIVDQAPYMWLFNLVRIEFVSERVGNYQWSAQWGSALLDQVWVQ
jgi:peptide/nickel transport system substrate-binding protein